MIRTREPYPGEMKHRGDWTELLRRQGEGCARRRLVGDVCAVDANLQTVTVAFGEIDDAFGDGASAAQKPVAYGRDSHTHQVERNEEGA
jgi:hypothetical protein